MIDSGCCKNVSNERIVPSCGSHILKLQYRSGLSRCLVFFVIVLSCSLSVFAQAGITTNAKSGAYTETQLWWFSVPTGQRLRIIQDGTQRYLGGGPFSLSLEAAEGAEHFYSIRVERLGPLPDSSVLERLEYGVGIDRKPPTLANARAQRSEAGRIRLLATASEEAEVYLLLDESGSAPRVFRGSLNLEIPERSLSALVWAKDVAGNYSEIHSILWQTASLEIAHPLPGTWANRQYLALSSVGLSELRYSLDGSDPIERGLLYEGPTLLDATGRITLRVAGRGSDGSVLRRELEYVCNEQPDERLAALNAAQAEPIRGERVLSIPSGIRYDTQTPASTSPLGGDLVLRSIPSLRRTVRYVFVTEDWSSYSCVYVLDGKDEAAAQTAGYISESVRLFDAPDAPVLHSAGAVRLLNPSSAATGTASIRFAKTEAWQSFSAPVPLPSEAETLYWASGEDSAQEYTDTLPALSVPAAVLPSSLKASAPANAHISGQLQLAALRDGTLVQAALLRSDGQLAAPPFGLCLDGTVSVDVCDGEDLRLVLGWNQSLQLAWRLDRRPPNMPDYQGPEEGSYHTRPLRLHVQSDEELLASLRWTDSDGQEHIQTIDSVVELTPDEQGARTYIFEARSRDAAGNLSQLLRREFTLDIPAVYVRSGAPAGGNGSKERPFSDVLEALNSLAANERASVYLSGDYILREPLLLPKTVQLHGGFNEFWEAGDSKSRITLESWAVFHLDASSLSIRNCSIYSEDVPVLFSLLNNSSLDLIDCSLESSALLVQAKNSKINMKASLLTSSSSWVYAQGGSLRVDACNLRIDGEDTALGIVAQHSDITFLDSNSILTAARYTSLVDLSGGSLLLSGSSSYFFSHDAALLFLQDVEAELRGSLLRHEGNGASLGVHMGTTPARIDTCEIEYLGSSERSSLFSGADPKSGSITGNSFTGWHWLIEDRYILEDGFLFDRRWAHEEQPNMYIGE